MHIDFSGPVVRNLIACAFDEDLGRIGDITGNSTLPVSMTGSADLILKADGVLAGLPLLDEVFHYIDPKIHIQINAQDGLTLKSGTQIAYIEGKMQSMLIAERTALNFLQRLSGIATLTRQFVDRVAHTDARILDTRKTTPGLRILEKYAVRQGGGTNHRIGLFDMVLIKDNHIDANGGIGPAIERCLSYLKSNHLDIPVEVETRSLQEVKEALTFPIQRIMLDNMSLHKMKEAIRLIAGRAETEASGNISLENVSEIAETEVDFISVGALTHSVKALDISMKICKK